MRGRSHDWGETCNGCYVSRRSGSDRAKSLADAIHNGRASTWHAAALRPFECIMRQPGNKNRRLCRKTVGVDARATDHAARLLDRFHLMGLESRSRS